MADSVDSSVSPRHALLIRLAVVVAAVVVGLALQQVLAARLTAIDELSRTDVVSARAQLATILEIAAVAVFGLTGALGVACVQLARRSLALGVFPAPGVLSRGTSRTATGEAARRLARVGIALGVILVLASTAGGALTWYMAAVLRACRAGVAPG